MKKVLIAISLVLVLAVVLAAPMFAAKPNDNGAEKIELLPAVDWDEVINGYVIVNTTPDGTTAVTIQIKVLDGIPEHAYQVKSLGAVIGEFTTNKNGSGSCHVNLAADEDLGKVNIWDGSARLLTATP